MFQIVLLEDAPADVELICRTLHNSGIDCDFVCVANRADFVKVLCTESFDLILADYALPSFDGLSALEIAAEYCPDIPFILVSGVLGEERAVEALKQGATDYVLKQRLSRLGLSVQRALRERQERLNRQQAEAKLHQTGDALRAILQAAPVGIITLNAAGIVETWNPAADHIYGWTGPEVIGSAFPVVPAADYPSLDDAIAQVLQQGDLKTAESRHQHRQGHWIEVQIAIAPLFEAGQPWGVVIVVSDITEQKQAEAERRHLLQREQAARVEAEAASRVKDEFLAVLSHELRTPLNSILGWVKLLRGRQLDAATVERALEVLERNATLQAHLIEDLLDVSRIIQGKLSLSIRPVNVINLIKATVETMRLAAEAKSIQINLVLDEPPQGAVLGDAGRLQQIFWNLLSNAIKFTPTGGQVTIAAHLMNAHLEIQVSDTGIGITADFLPHLFEHFRQADGSTTRQQGGLGLGLAITRHLVELHGGTIEAHSLGKYQGATFTVRLPYQWQFLDRTPSTNPMDELDLQGIQVLVVDDELETCNLLNFMLEQYGASVTAVNSASEAFQVLSTQSPDILISDISMPEEDGYSLIRQVRHLDSDQGGKTPAIALTAYARDTDRQKALDSGFDVHLSKPIDPVQLAQTILQLSASQVVEDVAGRDRASPLR